MQQVLKTMLENVRAKTPLVHNITNYVTVNDVANILLACGGSPIMSDEPEDVADITSICGGLNLNIGTLNQRSIEGNVPRRTPREGASASDPARPGRCRRFRPSDEHRASDHGRAAADRHPWQHL